MSDITLSVIVPVYGCGGTLVALHDRLVRVLERLVPSFEIVLIDDRGPDTSWIVMRELADMDERVVACRMSRNVGQQLAITAGIEQCRGAYAVVMDCDLQDPPEAIPQLWNARQGVDIVFARRNSDHQSAARLLGNRLYFRTLSWIAGRSFDGELGSFSLISRRVMDAFLRFNEQDRHYLMILLAIGFDARTIDYERATREIGETGYSFRKLLSLAVSGVMFSTTRVLHWVIYAGLAMAGTGVLLAVVLVTRLVLFSALPGWTSLIVAQLLVGGLLALCIGATGLYVGRIFEEVRRRPLYFVQDRLCRMDSAQSGVAPQGMRLAPALVEQRRSMP
jgi:glycosyltransferase involved in cell wall biosynthesis